MIRLIDIHKSFGKQKVLDGINLEIEDGKTTVIIGKSGGGKSVLLKHIISNRIAVRFSLTVRILPGLMTGS